MSAYDNIKGRLQLAENLVEGSFALDNAAAVGEEIDRVDSDIDYMPHRFFPLLAWGDDLTVAAANWGVERIGATAAIVTLAITGDVGTEIDDEVYVTSGDMIFRCSAATVGSDGTATVTAVCTTAGANGNVPAGAITDYAEAYEGLDTVINIAAATGGRDEENDADLLARIKARWNGVSQSGNKQDYLNWTLSVAGVSKAKVTRDTANHPGYVYIYVVGTNNTEASSSLVSETQAYIDSVRPIGATVVVSAAEAVSISVAVTATLLDGYTTETVKEAMEAAVSEYLSNMDFSDAMSISYLRLADLLFVPGVADISTYTINGGTVSLTLDADQFPILGGVTIG